MMPEVRAVRKEALYGRLLSCLEGYRQAHYRTADLDIAIIRKFAEGKNVVQITMEVPCAEATVYRAVKRVHEFLEQKTKFCQEQNFQNAEKEKV